MPEELTNADGQLVWQATYRTWGATVAEEWEVKTLAGQKPVEEGDRPNTEQNLRFQGQYLDRSTGLHYNTFRYYDADIGRFISPDPIGLQVASTCIRMRPIPYRGLILGGGVAEMEHSDKQKEMREFPEVNTLIGFSILVPDNLSKAVPFL